VWALNKSRINNIINFSVGYDLKLKDLKAQIKDNFCNFFKNRFVVSDIDFHFAINFYVKWMILNHTNNKNHYVQFCTDQVISSMHAANGIFEFRQHVDCGF
jgi:hypothetical protein